MTQFHVETIDGIGVVRPEGRLNMVAARQLKATLNDLVKAGTHRIVVDLEATTFIDSSGLGALIGGVKSTRQQGGDLRIARPTESVIAVLDLTNLSRILKPREDVAGAFDD